MGTLTNLSFFSGCGGLDLGAKMAGGIQTVGYCEFARYPQGVLRSRITDGGLDDAPIWNDINTFNGKPWRGVDIISGGFPCQDVSVAGKGKGIKKGTQSGLFYELMRVCCEIRPRFILLENVAGLLVYPEAHRVFGELASMGYDAGWKIISASDVGANHERKRIWIVAYSTRRVDGKIFDKSQKEGTFNSHHLLGKSARLRERAKWILAQSSICRVIDGMEFQLDRLKCCGNGVVPQQSIPAWEEIKRLSGIV